MLGEPACLSARPRNGPNVTSLPLTRRCFKNESSNTRATQPKMSQTIHSADTAFPQRKFGKFTKGLPVKRSTKIGKHFTDCSRKQPAASRSNEEDLSRSREYKSFCIRIVPRYGPRIKNDPRLLPDLDWPRSSNFELFQLPIPVI